MISLLFLLMLQTAPQPSCKPDIKTGITWCFYGDGTFADYCFAVGGCPVPSKADIAAHSKPHHAHPVKRRTEGDRGDYQCSNGWTTSRPDMCPTILHPKAQPCHGPHTGGTTSQCPAESDWAAISNPEHAMYTGGPEAQVKPPIPPHGTTGAGNKDTPWILAPAQEDVAESYIFTGPGTGSVSVESLDGSKMIKLTNEEYKHLQSLRQAVADEEKRIAVKYGADMGQVFVAAPCVAWDMGQCLIHDESKAMPERKPDHYEYKGQFLLIEKAK